MGTLLKVSNADFSTNGMVLCPPAPATEENLLPLFQNNAQSVGTLVLISTSSTDGTQTSISQDNSVFGVTRTVINSAFTFIKFKPKTGYTFTFRGFNQNAAYPTQIFSIGNEKTSYSQSGTPSANSKEVVIALDGFSEFAFNVRPADGVTEFQDNNLSNYFDYIKAVGTYTNPLEKLKAVMETKFYSGYRWGANWIYGDPTTEGNTRAGCGAFTSDMIDGVSFKITPKAGCKMVPLQGSGSAGRWTFSWLTTAQTYDSFATYPVFGVQVAYSNDAAISASASLWDFIDVELVS